MQQDASGGWLSADGAWRWDGRSWVPAGPRRLSFGDVIGLPAQSPGWLGTCGLEGLIGLIPIYGTFELLGWALSFTDNLRAGRNELPPARFGYASRGVRPALVLLILGLVALVLFYATFFGYFFAFAANLPQCPRSGCPPGQSPGPATFLVFGMFGLEFLYAMVGVAALALVLPIIHRAERLGVAAGLNVVEAIRMVRADWKTAGAGAVLVFFAYFVSSLGVYACFVGIVFTNGYAIAMLGAALRWFEQRLEAAPG